MAWEERSELRGTVLEGGYTVGPCIGAGGTGVVFEATRHCDGASVVVKTLRPTYVANEDIVRRFLREGEVSRRVQHPGLVPVLDEGKLDDGSPFLVMRRVHAESLSRLLRRRGMLGETEVAVIATRVTSILHAVHQTGYVHRDVKPEHVLLARSTDGRLRVTLLDFGVCAAETAPYDERERERGRVFGTPAYASPEQACGNPDVDGRADLFGLGVTMFEALAGHLPFHGDTITNLLRRIIREDAPRVSGAVPNVTPTMEALVAKLLARAPDERYASARAVARALAPVIDDRRLEERRLAAQLACIDTENDKPTLEAELQVA